MYGYIVLSEVGTLLVLKKLEGEDEEKTVNEVKKKNIFKCTTDLRVELFRKYCMNDYSSCKN